ncbi:MAG: beta-N-acetylhexosaminidase [Paracoccaceae bacterium]
MHPGNHPVNFGATILDAEGLRLTPSEKALFRDVNPFGFILFARNIETADQVRALCEDFREAVGHNCVVTIDQEGGRVQRLRAPLAREWLAPIDHVARSGEHADRTMYLRYRLIAHELHALGIDSNCAPCADLASDNTHPFLRNRCYGDDPVTVGQLARAAAQGMLDGGVLPVMKHMPGHGRSVMDSHKDLPRVDTSLEELSDTDFEAFRSLTDLPMGMTAHQVFSNVSEDPATLSPELITLIREDIGFDGLIMTDDISMKALSGTVPEISARAISAGCDVVLHCNADLKGRTQSAQAAGEMTPEAQIRAERALGQRHAPLPLDIEAAEAELSALMGGQVYG